MVPLGKPDAASPFDVDCGEVEVNLAGALKEKRIRIKDVRPAHYAALKKLVDFPLIAKSRL